MSDFLEKCDLVFETVLLRSKVLVALIELWKLSLDKKLC